MMSVIMLNVIMVSDIMLNIVMLSVAFPYSYADCQLKNALAYTTMKNTYCLFQINFITEYTNVQHIIITQI